MVDRAKVINGLTILKENLPHIIAYEYGDLEQSAIGFVDDVLELLNEQEPVSVYESEINQCVCGEILNRYCCPNYCGNCGRKLTWHHSRRGN